MEETLADPERELALSYAKSAVRPFLRALWAVDERFGEIVAGTTEPTIGEMRLLWWRDALAGVSVDTRAEPLIDSAAEAIRITGTDAVEWGAMAEGWHALLQEPIKEAELERFASERGRRLFRLSAAILGSNDSKEVERVGKVWALTDLAYRITDPQVAAAAKSMASSLLPPAGSWPRSLRPLGALVILARRDALGDAQTRRQGSPSRVARMAWHRLTGR